MFKIIFSVLILSLQVFAGTCLEIPEVEFNEWMKIRPKTPALSSLIQAKKIVDTEKEYALSLGTDKTAHCYLGCRVNAQTNFETARYLAWQKEHSDATDCNTETHFDVDDYEATLTGAQIPADSCATTCQKLY
jgi:hypothetical protein